MGKVTEKAVRITGVKTNYGDWNELTYVFPEITLVKSGSKIVDAKLPAKATSPTKVIINNEVYTLDFYIKMMEEDEETGIPKEVLKHIFYASPYARKSVLYDIINELNNR